MNVVLMVPCEKCKRSTEIVLFRDEDNIGWCYNRDGCGCCTDREMAGRIFARLASLVELGNAIKQIKNLFREA